jgi:tRNA pseudouridine38-40 synthase
VAAGAEAADLLTGMVRRLSGVLPEDLRVRSAQIAPVGFDARFSALSRRYLYRIADDPGLVDPLRRLDTAAWARSLNHEAMAAAAAGLVGLHDFAAYCRRREGATTVRGLLRLEVSRAADGVMEIDVEADAFCHSMVRSLVGALTAVGEGRRPVHWPAELLQLDHRANGVAVAPAHGLTLLHVAYPPNGQMAARDAVTRTLRAPVR